MAKVIGYEDNLFFNDDYIILLETNPSTCGKIKWAWGLAKKFAYNVSSSIHFSLSWWSTEWLFQNLIYSECMSDVAGVSAFALYMPLKITKIDDTMATIMITMYHQLTHEL